MGQEKNREDLSLSSKCIYLFILFSKCSLCVRAYSKYFANSSSLNAHKVST